jgi:phosphoglycerate dehydrogenase-like enzyme
VTKLVFTRLPFAWQLTELQQEFPQTVLALAEDLEGQLRELPDADAVVGWPLRDALPVAKKLRWVHVPFAGIEGINNVPELIEMDEVTVTNSRGAHAATIAEHCFAFILAFTRNIPALLEDKRAHRWDIQARSQGVRGLSGKVMGVLGLGNIGRAIARRALGFDMEVRSVDLDTNQQVPGIEQVWGLDHLDDLLRLSDYLAIAVPITNVTRGLIGDRELRLMKPDAYLCVMSRGGIVDLDALVDALLNGRLAGAGLDVTKPEPLPADHSLWDVPNVIISPHSSPHSTQMYELVHQILHENVRRFVADQPLLNVCNKRAGF